MKINMVVQILVGVEHNGSVIDLFGWPCVGEMDFILQPRFGRIGCFRIGCSDCRESPQIFDDFCISRTAYYSVRAELFLIT